MSSRTKKFDIKTSNHFLSNYKKEIIKYDNENINLTAKLSDLKTTLELNHPLLMEYFSKAIGDSAEIVELVNTTKQLWQENEQLVSEKNALEFKTFKLQETIEDTPTEIREELGIIQKENMKMKQMLIEKDATIKKLNKAIEKARVNSLFKSIRDEIMVTDPTSTNLSINTELIHTSQILEKVSVMNRAIKIKTDKVEKEVKMLQDEFTALKRDRDNKRLEKLNIGTVTPINQRNSKKRLPSATTGPIPKMNNDALEKTKKIMNTFFGHGMNASSSSDENSDEDSFDKESKIYAKNKQKKLELLKQEYYNLKNETDKNEMKIEKFKLIYKDIKERIQAMSPILRTQNQTERRISNIPCPEETLSKK